MATSPMPPARTYFPDDALAYHQPAQTLNRPPANIFHAPRPFSRLSPQAPPQQIRSHRLHWQWVHHGGLPFGGVSEGGVQSGGDCLADAEACPRGGGAAWDEGV